MQLHLATDELNLLANLLMEPSRSQPRLPLDDQLLEMVLARNLRFDTDELDRVADLLAALENQLKDAIARGPNDSRKSKLQQKLALLERVLEKVDEACVMI